MGAKKLLGLMHHNHKQTSAPSNGNHIISRISTALTIKIVSTCNTKRKL